MIRSIGTQAAAPRGGREAELREMAQGLESVFVGMLMKSMRATVKKSELFSGGRGEEMFTDLMDQRLGDAVSKRGGGLGLADMIVKKYGKHIKAAEDSKGQNLDIRSGSPGGSEYLPAKIFGAVR